MIAVLTTLHALNCVALIFVVLLQAGRGAGLAGVFGATGGGGGAIFGGSGAEEFLKKATAVLAVLFMTTSITLSFMSGQRFTPKSLLMEEAQRAVQQMPMIPPMGAEGVTETGLPPLVLPGATQEQAGGEAPPPPPETPTETD
ncbi:MAG: preprotein translocase subunit SecG [Candidatus Eisenbacteria sp.]|nr:preprotein translocase subunit SecG [Candidatus Eisenbacteria bacterium]